MVVTLQVIVNTIEQMVGELYAGLLAHFLNQNVEDGSHFRESLAGLVREERARGLIVQLHHFIIQNEHAIFEGLEFETGGMLQEIGEHLVIAIQSAVEWIEGIVGFQTLQHIGAQDDIGLGDAVIFLLLILGVGKGQHIGGVILAAVIAVQAVFGPGWVRCFARVRMSML